MDIQGLMRQAQEMQKKMQKAQEELANKTYEGVAGGGMVKSVASGAGVVKSVEIDPSLLDKEEKEVLEDLIVVAVNQAKKKAEEDSAASMKALTGGMPIPPGFKI
ncbi:MAG: YbaB/EbfC family nucleoid-associated protein [Proteobacteria bacterium]|nr:YbaB/EbfC family nucleoid-associated protein [Pseudomonadota bacterium]